MNEAKAAQDALLGLQHGLDSARRLVERTRSLLTGQADYDEGELAMSLAAPAPAAESDGIQKPHVNNA